MKLHFNTLSGVKGHKNAPAHGNHRDEVHVWSHVIHFDDPFLRESPYLLSSDEAQRAQKYHFEKDKRVYESGHVFIRKVLAHYTSLEASKLELTPIVNNKPQLKNSPFQIHFNISHSGNRIVVAVGFDTDVGIDVEKIENNFDMDGFADSNYHPNEIENFRKKQGDEETDYFYTIWTRKEAWLKLTGEGVNDKLRELDFSGEINQIKQDTQQHTNLFMTSWKDHDEYMVTLAAYIESKKIKFYLSDALFQEFTD